MVQFWKLAQPVLARPGSVRNLFLAGSSCATLGFLSTPARQFMDNMNAITPTKVNITLGVGLLLLASNACLAYLYYQSSKSENSEEAAAPSPDSP